jgi:hypothetical protein
VNYAKLATRHLRPSRLGWMNSHRVKLKFELMTIESSIARTLTKLADVLGKDRVNFVY